MKKIIVLVLMIVVLISIAAPSSAASANKAVQDARNGVVRIICVYYDEFGDGWISTGTGFAVGRKDSPVNYFVTNFHVIEDNVSSVYVILDTLYDAYGNFAGLEAEVVEMWASPDLAILRIKKPTDARVALPLASANDLEVTEGVFALGFPGVADYLNDEGYNLPSNIEDVSLTTGSVTKGLVVYNDTDCIGIDAIINHGNSGGPLVNEQGMVVGVNTYGLEGSNLAIYINYITQYFDDNNIVYYSAKDVLDEQEGSGKFALSTPVLIAIAAGAVVIIVVVVLVIVSSKKKKAQQPVMAGAYQPPPPQRAGAYPPPQGAGAYAPPQPAPAARPAPAVAATRITGVGGVFDGNSFPVADRITIGRDPKRCLVVFPSTTAGVSSLHCEVKNVGGTMEVTDRGSTYGTFLESGTKLETNRPYVLKAGEGFYVGAPENKFRVE